MIRAVVALLVVCGARADVWFLLPEPKFMGHAVTFPIEGARSTVLAPAKLGKDGIEFATAGGWKAAGLDVEGVRRASAGLGAEWMRQAEVELVRNRKQVVEYAVVSSAKVPACVTVFAPEFLKRFENVFGPKMLVVMPNRQTVFVFPGVAGDLSEHAPVVIEAWRSREAKVSLEVFELSAGGLRAVGRIEEP